MHQQQQQHLQQQQHFYFKLKDKVATSSDDIVSCSNQSNFLSNEISEEDNFAKDV